MIDIMPTPSVVAAAPKAAPPAADAMDPSRPGFAAMMTAAAPVMAGGRSPVRDADEPLAAEVGNEYQRQRAYGGGQCNHSCWTPATQAPG